MDFFDRGFTRRVRHRQFDLVHLDDVHRAILVAEVGRMAVTAHGSP